MSAGRIGDWRESWAAARQSRDLWKKQAGPAAATASIGDPVIAVERANALVSAFLAGLLKQERRAAAALMYILGRDVRANCHDLAENAGLEPGDDRFWRLGRYRWSWEREGTAARPGAAGPRHDRR